MNRLVAPLAFGLPFVLVLIGLIATIVGGARGTTERVRYGDVEALLNRTCSGCHPVIVPSLDLRAGHAYASMVGVRSVELPSLPRVVAGDPTRSFLYLKVAGWPGNHGNPIVGARMPFGEGPLGARDVALLRRWIEEGARNAQGKTVSASEVAVPGSVARLAAAKVPQVTTGDGTIQGTVTDARHRPIAGAVVTLLLVRSDLPGGEEHYLAGVTDRRGQYTIRRAPVGRVEIKAYAPGTTYVSRLLDTAAGQVTNGDVGLPVEGVTNPTISAARVRRAGGRIELAMRVSGSSLDPNYTLAVNPASGRVFELRGPKGQPTPGTWRRQVPPQGLSGRWIFMAISRTCTVSRFLTAAAPA